MRTWGQILLEFSGHGANENNARKIIKTYFVHNMILDGQPSTKPKNYVSKKKLGIASIFCAYLGGSVMTGYCCAAGESFRCEDTEISVRRSHSSNYEPTKVHKIHTYKLAGGFTSPKDLNN